jgi:hypothetical protein
MGFAFRVRVCAKNRTWQRGTLILPELQDRVPALSGLDGWLWCKRPEKLSGGASEIILWIVGVKLDPVQGPGRQMRCKSLTGCVLELEMVGPYGAS